MPGQHDDGSDTRLFRVLDSDHTERLRRTRQPEWTQPMLATLTDARFSDPGWIFERKFDGERVLVTRRNDAVSLYTRNRKCINDTYPEIVEALQDRPGPDLIADGEIVAFSGNLTSFARLQQRMQIRDPEVARASRVAVYLYLFDLLHCAGYCLEKLPLRGRKKVLKNAMRFERTLRYTAHRNEEGEKYHAEACDRGWEGIIAKRADAPYRHRRSRDWLKFKCVLQQELVIGGFTEPRGSRDGFGALLVGYYEDECLCYAGKVGTGFDDAFLRLFRRRLDRAARKTPPFDNPPDDRSANWVTPKFVGEFGFTAWTKAGKLRHPRFLGLRRDKPPREVKRERPNEETP